MSVRVLIPFRQGETDAHRLRALEIVRGYYADNFPEWPIVTSLTDPFSRARSLDYGVRHFDPAIVYVFQDADSLVPPEQLEHAVDFAHRGYLAWAYTIYCRLSRQTTEGVESWADLDDVEPEEAREMPSLGVAAISRIAYFDAGGYDRRFVEWGYEDSAFVVSCVRAGIPTTRIEGPLWHLWHPPAPGSDLSPEKSEDAERNRLLYEKEYANG